MEILWFCIVVFMFGMYVLLDGFDLGVGIIHRIIGRTESERSLLIKSIGPFWDGNEVWLLAGGGTLYLAFPKLYASGFSGFYLPLIILLWLLMLRGIGIEFRHLMQNEMWRSLWDSVFSLSSILLVIIFGAALGNIIRGVPIGADGYFFEPLWTTFTVVPESGILDWFTVTMGLVALFTLTSHGAIYAAMKTEDPLRSRARSVAAGSWWLVLLLSGVAIAATTVIRPDLWDNYFSHPAGFIFPLGGVTGLVGMRVFTSRGKELMAFISSSVFILMMLCATAFGTFPELLHSTIDQGYSITVGNAIGPEYGLNVAIVWWIFGFILTSGYFIYLYRSFRGKVSPDQAGY